MAKPPQYYGEARFSEIRWVKKQEIALPAGPILFEERENKSIGWIGANVFFGVPTPVTKMAEGLQIDLQGREDFQGFTHIYRYPPGTTVEQAEAWEIQSTTLLMNYLIEKSGVSPEMIGYVGLGCGTPIGDYYLERLVEESGIPFSSDTHFSEVSVACNGGTRALSLLGEKVETQPALQDRYAMLISLEGLGRRLIEDADVPLNQLTDPYSAMIFGNGLGGMLIPIGSMQVLKNTTVNVEDVNGNLAAIMSYTVDPGGPVVQTIRGKERIKLPPTHDGYKLFMRPNDAAKMFLGIAKQHLAPQFDPTIRVISAHQPASQMLEGFRRAFGVDDKIIPGVVEEGNMSGATETIARNRLMENFRSGDTVGFMGIGAGVQASFIKAKIL